ncbi:MAG: hypothetical protein ABIS01_03940 [Ferruginibacter sp.]
MKQLKQITLKQVHSKWWQQQNGDEDINHVAAPDIVPTGRNRKQQFGNRPLKPLLFKFLMVAFLFVIMNVAGQDIVTIPILTKDNTVVLQTDKDSRLWIVHFGKKMINADEYAVVSQQYI